MSGVLEFFSKITEGKIFRYPENIGNYSDGLQHFMIIKEYKFTDPDKNGDPYNALTSFLEESSFTIEGLVSTPNQSSTYRQINSFVLYLPPGSFRTVYSADYQDVELGFFGSAIKDNYASTRAEISNFFQEYKQNDKAFFDRTIDFYSDSANTLMKKSEPIYENYTRNFVERLKYNALNLGGAFLSPFMNASPEDIASQSMRMLKNPYTTLEFTGVKSLRTHTFNFEFRPKNNKDSKNILEIIASLKKGMLPSLEIHELDSTQKIITDDTSALDIEKNNLAKQKEQKKQIPETVYTSTRMASQFFKFPNVYTITFYDMDGDTDGNQYLYKIGQSVIESLNVNYGNSYFEEDGRPAIINMNLTFKENFALNQQLVDRGF